MPKRRGVALIEFLLRDDRLHTLVVRPDSEDGAIQDSSPIVLTCAVTRRDVEAVVSRLRDRLRSIAERPTSTMVENSDLTYLDALGSEIFDARLLNLIDPYDRLYIVPHDQLHYVPLHACRIDGSYLLDRFVVAFIPSASVLPFLERPHSSTNTSSVLAVGVDFTRRHHLFREEALQVFQLPYWPNRSASTLLLDEQATKQNVLAQHKGPKAIHISAHGYFSERAPLASGMLLHHEPYLDSPQPVVEFENTDLILDAQALFERATLDCDLAVLSGCVTGLSKHRPGDELVGMTRGLLYAGARSTILSLYASFKNITAHPTLPAARFARFYELWLGEQLPRPVALRRWLQEIRQQAGFEHPFYWFPFVYCGSLR